MRILKEIVHFSDEVSGSLIGLFVANRKITARIRQLERKEPTSTYHNDVRAQLPVDLLLRQLDEEHSRRRVVEDKARTNVLGIALAISGMFAGTAIVSSWSATNECAIDWQLWVFLPLLFLGIGFLLAGGWVALRVFRIMPVYTWTLEEESETPSEDKAMHVLWYIELNQGATTVKANQVSSSYSCIRNGIISIAVATLFMALSVLPF